MPSKTSPQMLAIRRTLPTSRDPLSALTIGDTATPPAADGCVRVFLRASSLNYADLWALRAPNTTHAQILGADGAGVDEHGNEVIVYPILAQAQRGGGDPMLDAGLQMLGQGCDGTFAEQIVVPRENLVPKPPELSWATAACLGTAWLTAYRMLFGRAALKAGETVLVQGAGGGVSTALMVLARVSGLRVWVSSRDPRRGQRAVDELGADAAFGSGQRLPEEVDAVMDTVGAATFAHSLASLRPGGRLVIAGATTGSHAELDLALAFKRSLSIFGSALGSPDELARLASLCVTRGVEPVVDSTWPLREGRSAFARLLSGELFGKVILQHE